MKNRIAILKQQAGDEAKKSGMLILGLVSGAAISKGLDKIGEAMPSTADFIKYAKPFVIGGGGFLISATTTKDELLKYFGYGLQGIGVYQGIKLIPFANEFLGINGLESVNEPSSYYTENSIGTIDLGNYGINALPVRSFHFENAPSSSLDLPNLKTTNTDLGYNPSATDETDRFKGII